MAGLDEFRSWVRRQGAPVTVAFIGSLLVAAFAFWFAAGQGREAVAIHDDWWSRPWTLATYPWAFVPFSSGAGIVGLVFLVLWVMWVGTSLEREMGSGPFAGFLLAMIVLPALFLGLGGMAMKGTIALADPWLPVEGLTVAWCTHNPRAVIYIFGILPLSGKWLGWLTVAATLLSMGSVYPPLGVLACLHLALAWAYASGRLPIKFGGGTFRVATAPKHATRAQAQYDESYYDEVRKRERERQERERLKKLLGESLEGDDEK